MPTSSRNLPRASTLTRQRELQPAITTLAPLTRGFFLSERILVDALAASPILVRLPKPTLKPRFGTEAFCLPVANRLRATWRVGNGPTDIRESPGRLASRPGFSFHDRFSAIPTSLCRQSVHSDLDIGQRQ